MRFKLTLSRATYWARASVWRLCSLKACAWGGQFPLDTVYEFMCTVSKERDHLANELKTEQERARNSSQAAAQLAEAKLAHALQAEAAKKDAEIQALQAKLEASETARQLAVTVAVNEAVGVVAAVLRVPRTSSRQPIQIIIRPRHLYLAQRMAVRQMAHHLHRLRLRLFSGKSQQGAVGFGV